MLGAQKDKLVEKFEVEGGIRSHTEVYNENLLIKCLRTCFRYRARQMTQAFYKWKYLEPEEEDDGKMTEAELGEIMMSQKIEELQKVTRQLQMRNSEVNDLEETVNLVSSANVQSVKNSGVRILQQVIRTQQIRQMKDVFEKVRLYVFDQGVEDRIRIGKNWMQKLTVFYSVAKKGEQLKISSVFNLWRRMTFDGDNISYGSKKQAEDQGKILIEQMETAKRELADIYNGNFNSAAKSAEESSLAMSESEYDDGTQK